MLRTEPENTKGGQPASVALIQNREWKYRIEGRTVDDYEVAVIFKFEGERAA